MATTTLNPPRSTGTFWRWASFLLAALLIAGFFYYAHITDLVDDQQRMMAVDLAILASLVVFVSWFLIMGPWNWVIRLGLVIVGFALLGGLIYAFTTQYEIRGVTGDWQPNIVKRGTPKPDESLPVTPPSETPKVVLTPGNDQSNFTGFLGSDGSNHVTGANLDPDWQKNPPKELWRKKVGSAWSAFAVVGSRAVTQEQRSNFEEVTCYNVPDGAVLWSHKDEGRFSEFQGGDGPRATPTIVGDHVFTMGAKGLLNCLELDTGNVVWAKNVLKDNGQENNVPMWAKSNSPLVYDEKIGDTVRQLVVVTLGEVKPETVPSLAAYDGKSGERVWTAGNDPSSYVTPILTTLAGTRQVVSVNANSVTGHDPATGKVLGTYAWQSGMWAKCSQPVVIGDDRLLLTQGYHVGSHLIQVAKKDGKWTAQEPPVWVNKRGLRTTFSNVAIYKGHAYGLDDGVLQCIDVATGQEKWRQDRPYKFRYGQVLGVDDLLLVQAEDGPVCLVAADPTGYRELAELDALHSKTWNNPVLVGKYLLLRNAEEAVCYEVPLQSRDR